MQLWNSASYSSVTTDCSRMPLKRWWCTQQELPEVRQNITHHLLPVHISESYHSIRCCSCHFVSQVSKTRAKLCAWTTKAEANYSPKPLSSKKGKIKWGKNQYSYFLYRENGRRNSIQMQSLHTTPETDFQMNVLKFQHFWAVAWTTWKGGIFNLVVGVFFRLLENIFLISKMEKDHEKGECFGILLLLMAIFYLEVIVNYFRPETV